MSFFSLTGVNKYVREAGSKVRLEGEGLEKEEQKNG